MMVIIKSLLDLTTITLVIVCVHSFRRCANYGDVCDLDNTVKCCDKLACRRSESESTDYFICFQEAVLDEYCDSHEDCHIVRHGKCSNNNKCECQPNYIRINSRHCAPLLGERCEDSEYCATENSHCVDNKCQCKDDFFSDSGERCLPYVIGQHCNNNSACSQVEFASCSDKICTCSPTTLGLSPALCVPLLDVFCKVDEDCKVEYSACIENKCKCKLNYKAYSYSKCKPMYLGTACRVNSDCESFTSNSVCSQNKICTCDDNYFQTRNGTCKPDHEKSCLHDELCGDSNSICVDKKCHCKPQYDIQGSKCVLKVLRKSCLTDDDCQRTPFAKCSSEQQCTCKENFVALDDDDDMTCVPKLGEICFSGDRCHIRNSICIRNQCQCKLEYLNIDNRKCILLESTERSCYTTDHDCRLFTSADCTKDGQCVCTEYKVKINSRRCTVTLGEFCTDSSQCRSKYSVCVGSRCKCKFEYVSHFNIDCPTPYLGMPCQHDSYCEKFIKNTVCLKNICVCGDMHSPANNKMCRPKLNVFCAENEQCAVNNSACIYNVCQCKSNYVQRGLKCVTQQLVEGIKKCSSQGDCKETDASTQLTLNKSCSTDYDCRYFQNSRCSLLYNICVCNQNNFGHVDNNCYPVLKGSCSKDKDCGKNFYCFDYECQCRPFFSPISVDQCVSNHQLYSCSDASDCSNKWHWECSEYNQCVCNKNNIAISNATCLPILDGYCWRDDQCMAENSICDDYRCRCRPNFIAIADNLCVLNN